jgi:dethiobiotin synthetase
VLDYEQVNPVALDAAVAPHIAASLQGKRMQASRLAGLCRGVMLGAADFVLIEGAGGWRVPINSRETMADVAIELRVGVILVVAMRLGCINHALLTAEAIRRDGLQLVAWVANQPGPRMNRHDDNLDTLRQLLPVPLLGDIPFQTRWEAEVTASYLDIQLLL